MEWVEPWGLVGVNVLKSEQNIFHSGFVRVWGFYIGLEVARKNKDHEAQSEQHVF